MNPEETTSRPSRHRLIDGIALQRKIFAFAFVVGEEKCAAQIAGGCIFAMWSKTVVKTRKVGQRRQVFGQRVYAIRESFLFHGARVVILLVNSPCDLDQHLDQIGNG